MMAVVEVSWEEPDGTSHGAIRARMEDTSRSGACIRVSTNIGVGATVWIKRPWEEIAGVTKYCRRDGMDYVLGVQRILEWRERNISPTPDAPFKMATGKNTRSVKEEVPSVPKQHSGIGNPAKASPAVVATQKDPEPSVSDESGAKVKVHVTEDISGETVSSRRNAIENPQKSDIPQRPAGSAVQTQPLSSEKERPSPGKERRRMSTSWLGLALKRPKGESPDGKANGTAASDSGAADEKTLMDKAAVNGDGNGFAKMQGDLQSLEDIYRAAGILNPRMGYSISKVVEMIHSDHMRGLPHDAKRAAILMALDAACISVEEVLRDAALRQGALDAYEASQQKSFEEYWGSKAEANVQIQAETDRIVARNQERIQRNRDEVANEKAEFAKWRDMKQKETERMSEAAGLCAKAPAPEVIAPGSSVAPGQVPARPSMGLESRAAEGIIPAGTKPG